MAELIWMCHLVSLFTMHFTHVTMLYCNIALHTDAFLVIYGEYSTYFYFDPPTQSSLNKRLQEDHLLAVSVSPKY